MHNQKHASKWRRRQVEGALQVERGHEEYSVHNRCVDADKMRTYFMYRP